MEMESARTTSEGRAPNGVCCDAANEWTGPGALSPGAAAAGRDLPWPELNRVRPMC
jgi:hypothetical protein